MVRAFSSENITATEEIIELTGSPGKKGSEDGLMHTALESDQQSTDGKLIKEALNQGFSSFIPDMIFKNLVSNYSLAEKLYGKTFISLVTGFDEAYVGRNVRIPEFQQELKERIAATIKRLNEKGLLDKDTINDDGIDAASVVLLTEELDKLLPTDTFGEQITKKHAVYGTKADTKKFKSSDRYRDLALRKSIKRALRRGHKELTKDDLETYERKAHSSSYIIYALDASGSMKGQKIDTAKKAGVALAYKAIENNDKVGLLVFSKKVKTEIAPTDDFHLLLHEITKVKTGKETDIVPVVEKAIELFPSKPVTKHIIFLSDALPTVGTMPEQETLEVVAKAHDAGISISIIGIGLSGKGEKLAKKIVEIGQGRLYNAKSLEDVDRLVIEEYETL